MSDPDKEVKRENMVVRLLRPGEIPFSPAFDAWKENDDAHAAAAAGFLQCSGLSEYLEEMRAAAKEKEKS